MHLGTYQRRRAGGRSDFQFWKIIPIPPFVRSDVHLLLDFLPPRRINTMATFPPSKSSDKRKYHVVNVDGGHEPNGVSSASKIPKLRRENRQPFFSVLQPIDSNIYSDNGSDVHFEDVHNDELIGSPVATIPTTSANENNNPNLPQDNGEHIPVPTGGVESLEEYIERISGTTTLGRYGFCFFSSVKNLNQEAAFDNALDLVGHDFTQMHCDDKENIHLPTDYDNPSDMPPLMPGGSGGYLYLALQERSSGVVEGKLGQTKIDATKKQGYYDEKNGVGKTVLKCVFSINEQNMGTQRMARARFDATNPKLCRIAPGGLV